MANDVEIVVKGRDASQAALESARQGARKTAADIVSANLRVEKAVLASAAAEEKFGRHSLQAREAAAELVQAEVALEAAAGKATAAQDREAAAAQRLGREAHQAAAGVDRAAERTRGASSAHGAASESAGRLASALGRVGSVAGGVASAGLGKVASAARTAGTASAVGLGLLGVAAFGVARSVVKLGVDYQEQLNMMQAVTRSTDATMAQVAKTARDLGNDMSLPATSAADAAQAMTELAKGNLTAQQAMAAAKGTLQLAAAAHISGAEAAKIQADALGAFSLKAASAGHVADVLANASNAATGEISDFAQGLAASSAVAHQFGLSVDDTVTALALFANAGIHGSDAGTSLKSALLALASPSAQAAKALGVLRLHAFDAHGNFVGLESISQQLASAQGRLSQQTFAAATSTAFGSDAARAAGVLAANGAAGWDKMSASIGHAGGASEAAKARMKGVGGAIAGLKSELETIKIDIFTAAAPAIERFVRALSGGLPGAIDAVKAGFAQTLHPVQAVTHAFETAWDAAHHLGGLLHETGAAMGPMITATKTMGDLIPAALGPLKPSLDAARAGADAVKDAFTTMGPIVGSTGKLMGGAITPMGPMLKQAGADARSSRLTDFFHGVGVAVANVVLFVRRNWSTWADWARTAAGAGAAIAHGIGGVVGWLHSHLGPALTAAGGWWARNKVQIAGWGAVAEQVLLTVGGGWLIFAGTAVQAVGYIIGWMAHLVHAVMDAYALILHGAAAAFGWLPGIGDKITTARDLFDGFSRTVDKALTGEAKAAGAAGKAMVSAGHSALAAADKAGQLKRRLDAIHSRQIIIAAIDRAKPVADRIAAAIGAVKGKTVRIIVNQIGDIQHIQREINALTGKAISIQVGAVGHGPAGHASGGIVGAATGGVHGGLRWVGEQGAELVRLPYGSTVYPHGQSERMAAGQGGGGNTYNIAVTVAPGGHPADVGGKIVDLIRRYEQRSGHAWRTA